MSSSGNHIVVDLDSLTNPTPTIVKGDLLDFLQLFDEAKIETYSANPPFYTMLFEQMDYKRVEVVFGNRAALGHHVGQKLATAKAAFDGKIIAESFVERWMAANPKTSAAIISKSFVSHVTAGISHKKVMLLSHSAKPDRYLLLGSANASIEGVFGAQPEVSMVTGNPAMIAWFEAEFANVQGSAERLEGEDLLAWGMACG